MLEGTNLSNAFPDLNKGNLELASKGKIRSVSPGVDLEEKDCFVGITENEDEILIAQPKMLGQNPGIRIPFDEILFDEIKFSKKEDKDYQNLMTSAALFSGRGPVSTFSKEKTFIQLPYEAEKGVKRITLTLNDAKKFLDILQENSPEGLLKKSEKEGGEDSPLEILKKRFAEGEISEEEFKKKKEMLEE